MDTLHQNKTTAAPVISIITVVLNRVNVIERAIQSVLNQGYPHVQYIIIDGGSVDGTVDVIKKYEDQLSYWVSEKDNGIYDAINKGLAKASGDIIGIINSDDWYEDSAFETVVASYQNNKDVDVLYGLLRFWDTENKLLSVQGYTHNFLPHGMISHPTCFVTKECYKKYGVFNISYKIAADYALMLNIYNQGGQFYFIEKVLANFVSGGVSTTMAFKTKLEHIKIQRTAGVISEKLYWVKRLVAEIKLKTGRVLQWLK